MPSNKKLPKFSQKDLPLFWTLLVLALIFWWIYRFSLHFPVWFDETIGKALFFGIPPWVFIQSTGFREISDSWRLAKFKPGLLQGVAFGGIFGFAAVLATMWASQSSVIVTPLFASQTFWYEFMLALLTGFWETLFFYSFVFTVLVATIPTRHQAIATTLFIFILFHLPNTILRYQVSEVPLQLILLTLFALGQALVFLHRRNAYTLALTQAIWGMVLLVHLS